MSADSSRSVVRARGLPFLGTCGGCDRAAVLRGRFGVCTACVATYGAPFGDLVALARRKRCFALAVFWRMNAMQRAQFLSMLGDPRAKVWPPSMPRAVAEQAPRLPFQPMRRRARGPTGRR